MPTENVWTISTVVLAGISTLAIFSFLIGENRFYRFFEHLFIGIAAGLSPVLIVRDFLWPKVLEPMLGFTTVTFPDGTIQVPYDWSNLLFLFPMIFGLLYYCIYSRKYAWLAKLVIGFSLGASGGLAFKGFFAEVLPQITSSFRPLIVFENAAIDWRQSLSNCIFVGTLFSVMYYFFFTIKKESAPAKAVSYSGRMLLMVCFGAFFGSTVMARLALLVERVQFLLEDWPKALASLQTIIFSTVL